MKRVFVFLAAVLFAPSAFCADGMTDVEPNLGISLNPQDVPIFYDNSPLTGMKSFMFITTFPLKDTEMQKRIEQSIEGALKETGEVIRLKDNDMRGFGAGNVLLVQMDNVAGWDESKMPVSRISLSVETPVTLDKTGVKTFPMVWSINTFLQGNIDSGSEGNLTRAIQKLVGDFVQSYQYANQGQAKKPVFYTYD